MQCSIYFFSHAPFDHSCAALRECYSAGWIQHSINKLCVANEKHIRLGEARRTILTHYLTSIAVCPQRLTLDPEIKHRDVVAAKVRDVQLIKIRAAKCAIGGLAEQQVLHVLAKKLDETSG